MAVTHPSSRVSARQSTPQPPEPKFKPDEDAWKCVCGEVGVKYRGYIRPCESDKGERFEATVLFNDRYGLVTGLPLSEFNAENVRARLMEREPEDARIVRRASPEPRTRLEDSIQDGFERVLTAFRANRNPKGYPAE
jgi:hypothetical protein